MTKLNQILAIEKGEKNTAYKALTELHRASEQAPLYEGRVRTYRPLNEDGEPMPDETQVVQQTARSVLKRLNELLVPFWDTTATKDVANTKAVVDIEVNGKVLAPKVPVTYLLFLEKQLSDLDTFIQKLPTLDASQVWREDTATPGQFITDKVQQNRTKKVLRNHVRAEATDKHPAQVDTYTEDQVVGQYESIRKSGALSVGQKQTLQARLRQLREAVLFAREQANSIEVQHQRVSENLLGFLLNDLK